MTGDIDRHLITGQVDKVLRCVTTPVYFLQQYRLGVLQVYWFDMRWASIYVSVIHAIFLLFFLVVIHIDIVMTDSQETFEQAKARVIK